MERMALKKLSLKTVRSVPFRDSFFYKALFVYIVAFR